MDEYEELELEIIEFDEEDVITSSPGDGDTGGECVVEQGGQGA